MVVIISLCFVALDMATGVIKAIKDKTFSSSVMREGLFHKAGSLLVLSLAVMCDYCQKYIDLGFHVPLTNAICTYIIIMEIGSTIENIGKINPNLIPETIRKYFFKLSKEKE